MPAYTVSVSVNSAKGARTLAAGQPAQQTAETVVELPDPEPDEDSASTKKTAAAKTTGAKSAKK
ncbi:hypothetical protein ACIRPQ_28805 [Streptomyces sp. NPDC101213]|uniref:hypothetical protein n=1 Tax=Streptomyces sp. NPDC101213 TaxID=3366130 RepID=UPI00380F1FBA